MQDPHSNPALGAAADLRDRATDLVNEVLATTEPVRIGEDALTEMLVIADSVEDALRAFRARVAEMADRVPA